jgi:hypothetical protein
MSSENVTILNEKTGQETPLHAVNEMERLLSYHVTDRELDLPQVSADFHPRQCRLLTISYVRQK